MHPRSSANVAFVSLWETKATLPLLLTLLALGIAGCGGGDSATGAGGPAATGGSYVDWPLFGRVPARTHYLPAEEKALDPPLKQAWSVNTHALIEFPPAVDGRLYLGTDTTNLLALDAASGRTIWSFNAPSAIKASPSYDDGKVFFADYQSSMFAIDAKSGRLAWRSNTSKVPPYGRGGFFSSPAVAFGNVYAARDDGTVYAFDEQSGKVAWHFDAGAAVYGSPAVAQVPGTPPTVYIGAENGRF